MRKLLIIVSILAGSCVTFAQTIPVYIPKDSLLAWYPFNGNAMNEAGTRKNGIPVGPVPTTDRFGRANSAYNFNGMSDHISIDTAFFNLHWSNYTISYWINSDSVDNYHNADNIQIAINTVPHNGFALSHNFNLTYKYNLFFNSNPAIHTWDILGALPSHTSIVAHSWRHFVLEKKNDTAYSFFVNGVLDSVYISHTLPVTYLCKLIIGDNDTIIGGNYGFWGKLDDYAMWNRALAVCEIRRLYDTAAFTYLTSQPSNVTVSAGATTHFSIVDTGTGNTYQWQCNTGSGFVNLTGTAPYSGVTTPTLTVSPVTTLMNNYKYRCVVAGAYPCTDTSAYGKLQLSTSGISNAATSSTISLAPNPTTGDVIVLGTGKVSIKIFNAAGQLVKEAANTDRISINELPAGPYSVKLYSTNGTLLYYDKVIKL